MFALRKPAPGTLERVRQKHAGLPLSHDSVGADAGCPPGYVIDHNRVRLGAGAEVYARARAALRDWRMLQLGWIEPAWPTKVAVGALAGTLTRVLGVWTLNVCRIVQVIDETGPVARFGLTWATLPGHVERGEERFQVEWHAGDDSVWYDLWALSAPGQLLTWLGYPLARRWQKRFARDSLRAMQGALHAGPA